MLKTIKENNFMEDNALMIRKGKIDMIFN